MSDPECARCVQLQQRLEHALAERDASLLELARAREALNRYALAERWRSEEEPPAYPLEAGAVWPVPLRYRMVDTLNAWMKGTLPGLQRYARRRMRRGHGP